MKDKEDRALRLEDKAIFNELFNKEIKNMFREGRERKKKNKLKDEIFEFGISLDSL